MDIECRDTLENDDFMQEIKNKDNLIKCLEDENKILQESLSIYKEEIKFIMEESIKKDEEVKRLTALLKDYERKLEIQAQQLANSTKHTSPRPSPCGCSLNNKAPSLSSSSLPFFISKMGAKPFHPVKKISAEKFSSALNSIKLASCPVKLEQIELCSERSSDTDGALSVEGNKEPSLKSSSLSSMSAAAPNLMKVEEGNEVVVRFNAEASSDETKEAKKSPSSVIKINPNCLMVSQNASSQSEKSKSQAHVNQHPTNGNRCSVCEKVFFPKRGFYMHMRSKHSNGKAESSSQSYKVCEVCGHVFKRPQRLQYETHLAMHAGEKSDPCDICGKQFHSSIYLKTHRRICGGERRYKCAYCGLSFTMASVLKNHVRLHTGEMPYKCSECNQVFRTNNLYRRHYRKFHKKTNEAASINV